MIALDTMALDTLRDIELWHERARPNPAAENFNVQLGCHFEEIGEMLACIDGGDWHDQQCIREAQDAIESVAYKLKNGIFTILPLKEKSIEFLDSLADQIVTAVGVGHCANMDVTEACKRVSKSNWSKFVDGQPVFNEAGKIQKGPDYVPVDLRGLV